MSMSDGEIRQLCNRFFDAYQDRRIDEYMDAGKFPAWRGARRSGAAVENDR